MKEEEMTVEGFYRECAKLLCADHTYREFPYRKRTRWNNREPGNGRFVGHGLIRFFSSTCNVVSLRYPALNCQFKNIDDALMAIKFAAEAAGIKCKSNDECDKVNPHY